MTISAADNQKLERARRQVFHALLIALAVGLHVYESLLPSPFPWLKLGLANIMTLTGLYLFDARTAWSVSLARVFLGALILGRLMSPGFWLALSGAIAATLTMVLLYKKFGNRLSIIGVSALGAVSHLIGQILVARFAIIQHEAVWRILPPFMISSVLSGVLTGWFAALLIEKLRSHPAFGSVGNDKNLRV